MRWPRYKTKEIAEKSPKAKSTGIASWKENTGGLTGCELSTSSRWAYENSHIQMSEEIPANDRREEISRQFSVCPHNLLNFLLDSHSYQAREMYIFLLCYQVQLQCATREEQNTTICPQAFDHMEIRPDR